MSVTVMALVVLQRRSRHHDHDRHHLDVDAVCSAGSAPARSHDHRRRRLESVVLGLTAGYRSDRIKAFMNPDLDSRG
ncbi:hypothetical protein GS531_14360 [Rhodococcus hoagii]|nr:hypothetical protein [Prescottella equi]